MIVTRAPMRVSFAGGGTDLPDFYEKHGGRVISTAIDKFVHVVVNRTPLVPKISARYSIAETVDHPRELRHTRIKAALLDMKIYSGLEIASFATLPSSTGLGSSSSFSVALLKALHAYMGETADRRTIAEEAVRLEIDLLKEPIGKQDQYAAAFGGMNVFEFRRDGEVHVRPVLLDFKLRLGLEEHMLLFYTGITRAASSVLAEQKANIAKRTATLKKMADSVLELEAHLLKGDFRGMGKMLSEGWEDKKTLSSGVSNPTIDALYDAGMGAGAWGGKLLGAGAGGCLLFMAAPAKQPAIVKALAKEAKKKHLIDTNTLPVRLIQSGVELVHNSDHVVTFG